MQTRLTTLLALGLTAAPLAAARADNRAEIGAFAGAHIYNDDNELGVVDVADATSLQNAVTFGVRLAFRVFDVLSAEGELGVVPTRGRDSDVDVVNLNWRVHAIGHLGRGRLRPFGLIGVGGATAQSSDTDVVLNDTDVVGQAGVGLKWRAGDDWGVRFDARSLLAPSSAGGGLTSDWELTVAMYRTFGAPAAAAPAPALSDPDGDKLVGDADECPDQAEDVDGNDDADGCPDLDDDGDHIPDREDGCPTQPENVNGFEDDDGCPDQEPDADGDGVTGAADRCPDDVEDRDGHADDDGCPDPDNDNDGVSDAADTCPTELESPNGWQDDDGCADEVPPQVQAFTGVIKGVAFTGNGDRLTAGARRTLDGAAKMLQDHPAVRIEISAHTDDAGDREQNVALSQRRADAVKAYLVGKGVAADRIQTVGHGPDRPAADNATSAGKAANRRVEVRLIGAPGPAPAPAAQPEAATPPSATWLPAARVGAGKAADDAPRPA